MRFLFVSAWVLGVLVSSLDAQAASYGDFVGSQVTFRSVTDLHGLLRPPELVGDALSFDPVDYDLSCPGIGLCDAPPLQLGEGSVLEVVSHPGSSLGSLTITLVGERLIDGVAGELAAVSAFSRAFVTIRSVDGVAREIGATGSGEAKYELSSLEAGATSGAWSTSFTVDLDEILARENAARLPGQQIVGHATRVDLDLAFGLGAVAPPGGSARIGFADVGGIVVTAVVPEPNSACLTTLGLLALASARQRSSPRR